MLKYLRSEIVLGALLATIFWTAVLGWQASYAPTEIEKQQCYETAQKSGHKTDECKTFWERTTTDPVALFTLVLACTTLGLWTATIGLYFAGRNAVSETRRIGEAQVRAYVHIKFIVLNFEFSAICPRISFIASNTPTRILIDRPFSIRNGWNIRASILPLPVTHPQIRQSFTIWQSISTSRLSPIIARRD
jgi:hypothetical protein